MEYILVIWTSVASNSYYGWRPIGEFRSEASCTVVAGNQLHVDKDGRVSPFRCLKK